MTRPDVSEIRWALFMPEGKVIHGSGPDAPGSLKLSNLARDAVHLMFQHPAGPPIYVSGSADLLWTVRGIVGTDWRARALGLLPILEGSRIWLMPDGSLGIGRTTQEVAVAYDAFARATA